jgi:hypothetical protein
MIRIPFKNLEYHNVNALPETFINLICQILKQK